MMKKLSGLLCLVLLSCVAVFAQAVPAVPVVPPEPNNGVTITGGVSYTMLTNGAGSATNVTKIELAAPITSRFSAVYNQYIVPAAQANVYIGAVRYTRLLSQIIKPTPSTVIDLTKFTVYGDCGMGSRHDSISNARTGFALACNAGISYNPAANVSFTLQGGYIRAGVGYSSVPGLTLYNLQTPMISPGVTLTF